VHCAEKAFDADNKLKQSKSLSINKVGHGMLISLPVLVAYFPQLSTCLNVSLICFSSLYVSLVDLHAPDHCSIRDSLSQSFYLPLLVCSIQLCMTWTQCFETFHDQRKYQLWLPHLAIRDLHQFNPCTFTRYDLCPIGSIVNYLQDS